jgi:cutinase
MIRLGIEKRQAACKPNALLFARGTTEPGTMGTTVGPALSRALGSKWRVEGVKYTADIAGDDCIGFPGGIKCRDQLEVLAQACPETKWFLAGYSQGAMVARICTAFSKPEIKEKIKVGY